MSQLSHSSAQEFRGCEYRWWLRKVEGIAPDSDYSDSDGLSVGKAFHHVQERSKHEPADLAELLKECEASKDIGLSAEHFGLVAVMSDVYWRYQAQSKLKVVGVEYAIESPNVSGFLDLISMDEDGVWYIEDLKCFKSFSINSVVGLPKDPQLNLYASFFSDVAKHYGLKAAKFGGAGYRIITKTTSKKRENETISAFVDRTRKAIKVYRMIVPVARLDTCGTRDRHDLTKTRADAIIKGETNPRRNYGYCMNYFSPCQFWSKCHGQTYSESVDSAKSQIEVFEV